LTSAPQRPRISSPAKFCLLAGFFPRRRLTASCIVGGMLGGGMHTVVERAKAGGVSAWGLANAVTRKAEDATDYDRATELEAAGGRVIELPPAEWRALVA
jgi:hypothetical protein